MVLLLLLQQLLLEGNHLNFEITFVVAVVNFAIDYIVVVVIVEHF